MNTNLQKHNYTKKLREGKWEATISPSTNYGYYEHDDYGEGGGLWFDGKELVDFDGRGVLPKDIVTALRGAGYILDETFD